MPSYLYKYPIDLDSSTGEYSHRITFTALLPQQSTTVPSNGDTVALYLPADALKTSYSQSFGDVELGSMGQAISSADKASLQRAAGQLDQGDIVGALKSVGTGVSDANIKDALISGTVKEILGRASQSNQTAVAALSRATGRVVNPHKAIIYNGPGGFRTFSYTFTMSPKSPEEAEQISKIVYFFKYHMHPGIPGSNRNSGQTSSARNINTSATLTYPEEFQIEMRVNGNESGVTGENGVPQRIKPLFKIDKCFLESFNVDYTTAGNPAFLTDDSPVTTTIALQFKETILMTKERIDQGY